MTLRIEAHFESLGKFYFENPKEIINPNNPLYQGAHIDFDYSCEGYIQHFKIDGSEDGVWDGLRSVIRDFLQGLACNLRTSDYLVLTTIREMVTVFLDDAIMYQRFDRDKILYMEEYKRSYIHIKTKQDIGDGKRLPEDIAREYDELLISDTLEVSYQDLRDALKEEYLKALPDDQRLAIYLHDSLCHRNHTDGCWWDYEIFGIRHKWSERTHRRYLVMAQSMLRYFDDIEVIKQLIHCIATN